MVSFAASNVDLFQSRCGPRVREGISHLVALIFHLLPLKKKEAKINRKLKAARLRPWHCCPSMRQSCPEELILMRSAPNTCDLLTHGTAQRKL